MKYSYEIPVRSEKVVKDTKKVPQLPRTNLSIKGLSVVEYETYIEKEVREVTTPPLRESKDSIRLIMFGGTNSGKSATGNMILGNLKFLNFNSKHKKENILQEGTSCFDKTIRIVKTPGICISSLLEESNKTKIVGNVNNARQILETEPDAYLYIISSINDFVLEAKLLDVIYRRLRRIIEKIIIVFTGFDHFKNRDTTRFTFLEELPDKLKTFVRDCDERVVFFDNTRLFHEETAKMQVKQLIKVVENLSGHY